MIFFNTSAKLHYLGSVLFPDGSPTPIHTTKQQWVTKWVDYSNKYGFGFQLSDKSVGILFNDTTRILLANDGKYVLTFYAYVCDDVLRNGLLQTVS